MITIFSKERVVRTLLFLLTLTTLNTTSAVWLPFLEGEETPTVTSGQKQPLRKQQPPSAPTNRMQYHSNKNKSGIEISLSAFAVEPLFRKRKASPSNRFDQIYTKAKDEKEMFNKLKELEGQIKERLNLPIDKINTTIAKQILNLEWQRLAVLIAGHQEESAKYYRKYTYYENLNKAHVRRYRHHYNQAYKLITILSDEMYKDYQDFINQTYYLQSQEAFYYKNKANLETGHTISKKTTFMELQALPWKKQLLAIMSYYARLYKPESGKEPFNGGELERQNMKKKMEKWGQEEVMIIVIFFSALEALIAHMVALSALVTKLGDQVHQSSLICFSFPDRKKVSLILEVVRRHIPCTERSKIAVNS